MDCWTPDEKLKKPIKFACPECKTEQAVDNTDGDPVEKLVVYCANCKKVLIVMPQKEAEPKVEVHQHTPAYLR